MTGSKLYEDADNLGWLLWYLNRWWLELGEAAPENSEDSRSSLLDVLYCGKALARLYDQLLREIPDVKARQQLHFIDGVIRRAHLDEIELGLEVDAMPVITIYVSSKRFDAIEQNGLEKKPETIFIKKNPRDHGVEVPNFESFIGPSQNRRLLFLRSHLELITRIRQLELHIDEVFHQFSNHKFTTISSWAYTPDSRPFVGAASLKFFPAQKSLDFRALQAIIRNSSNIERIRMCTCGSWFVAFRKDTTTCGNDCRRLIYSKTAKFRKKQALYMQRYRARKKEEEELKRKRAERGRFKGAGNGRLQAR